MAISSNIPRKVPFECFQLDNISWTTPAYAYRYAEPDESEEDFTKRLLDAHFQDLSPENVAAFMAETVVGATTRCTTAPVGYFKGVREICDKYDILLILVEVMCGVGGTGTYFAFEQEGVVPDILTIAKGFGGGYGPISGLLIHKRVVDVLRDGTGSFCHGQTYQAHPIACAATLCIQKIIQRDGLIETCAQRGIFLESLLKETFSDAKFVGDIRGRGRFWGLEFVPRSRNPSAVSS